MKRKFTTSILLSVLICLIAMAAPAEAGSRFGGGIHYLKTLGDIKDSTDFDENAISFMGSVVFTGVASRLEYDVEFVPDYGGSGKLMIQPQAYAMFGNFIYGGVGIGIGHFDGGWQTNPFYAIRTGVDFAAGGLDLDLFACYRFQKTNDLDHLGAEDLNSITLVPYLGLDLISSLPVSYYREK